MNVITFNGTTSQAVGVTPWLPGNSAAIINLSGSAVQPQSTLDGTTWTNWGGSLATATVTQVTIPAGARAVRLAAAGAAFMIADL